MSNFIQEIKNHNINKALNLEMVFRTSDEDFNKAIDEVADTLNKSFLDGLVDEQAVEIDFKNLDVILEKARPHKYYRREGGPGNYKYYYTKEEYEQDKKKVEGGKEGLRINESQRKTVENKSVGSIHEHNGKKYKKQSNGKWVEVSEHGKTYKEHKEEADKLQDEWLKLDRQGGAYRKSKELKEKHSPHYDQVIKLSDKEYSDEEVGGEEDTVKVYLGDHKFKQESIGSRVKITRQGEGEIKGQDKQGRFIIEMDNGEVKILPKGGFKFINKEYTDEEVGLGEKREWRNGYYKKEFADAGFRKNDQ